MKERTIIKAMFVDDLKITRRSHEVDELAAVAQFNEMNATNGKDNSNDSVVLRDSRSRMSYGRDDILPVCHFSSTEVNA